MQHRDVDGADFGRHIRKEKYTIQTNIQVIYIIIIGTYMGILLFWTATALSLPVAIRTYIIIIYTIHAYTTNVRVLLVIKDSQKGKKSCI